MVVSEVSERGGYGLALVTMDSQGSIKEVVLKEMDGEAFKDDSYIYEVW